MSPKFKVGDKVKIKPEKWESYWGYSEVVEKNVLNALAVIVDVMPRHTIGSIDYNFRFKGFYKPIEDYRDPITCTWTLDESYLKFAEPRKNPTYRELLELMKNEN